MKEMSRVLPILFNTDMVRAILDGRKTVTRRLMKPQPLFYTGRKYIFADDECPKKWECCDNIVDTYQYQPGDILYVRETWQEIMDIDMEKEYLYRADDDGSYTEDNPCWRWRPSIHMPKEAARIWLKVTNVRVERLQDITEEQAEAEGMPDNGMYPVSKNFCSRCKGEGLIGTYNSETLGFMEVDCPNCNTAIKRFKNLWNSTIKKFGLDRYGWDANPWVWVIEFERCEKPEDI